MRETQLPTHTTPPPHADQTAQTAEPARRAPRFDERGIALQTIIIMVVLLAIAGSVAAVIINRAGTETDRLESQTDSAVYGIENETACKIGGHSWGSPNVADATEKRALEAARPDKTWGAVGATPGQAFCKP